LLLFIISDERYVVRSLNVIENPLANKIYAKSHAGFVYQSIGTVTLHHSTCLLLLEATSGKVSEGEKKFFL
jgi:hypothetical protein